MDDYRRRWSGPTADKRDPQVFGDTVKEVVKKQSWDTQLGKQELFVDWDRIVGQDVATHASPEKLEEGILFIRAVSTAWATQLRLMQSDLLRKIAAACGHNVVRQVRIYGPAAPSWRYGKKHVSGRGPRDTYG